MSRLGIFREMWIKLDDEKNIWKFVKLSEYDKLIKS